MCINKSKPIKKSPPFKGDLEGHLPVWKVASPDRYGILKKFAQENRNNMTEAENAKGKGSCKFSCYRTCRFR